MLEVITAMAVPLLLVSALILALTREDARLRQRARRYRELELEGIEELPHEDPYPEEAGSAAGFLRDPNGRAANAHRVLREDLERAREYTRRQGAKPLLTRSVLRGKGAECLL